MLFHINNSFSTTALYICKLLQTLLCLAIDTCVAYVHLAPIRIVFVLFVFPPSPLPGRFWYGPSSNIDCISTVTAARIITPWSYQTPPNSPLHSKAPAATNSLVSVHILYCFEVMESMFIESSIDMLPFAILKLPPPGMEPPAVRRLIVKWHIDPNTNITQTLLSNWQRQEGG